MCDFCCCCTANRSASANVCRKWNYNNNINFDPIERFARIAHQRIYLSHISECCWRVCVRARQSIPKPQPWSIVYAICDSFVFDALNDSAYRNWRIKSIQYTGRQLYFRPQRFPVPNIFIFIYIEFDRFQVTMARRCAATAVAVAVVSAINMCVADRKHPAGHFTIE